MGYLSPTTWVTLLLFLVDYLTLVTFFCVLGLISGWLITMAASTFCVVSSRHSNYNQLSLRLFNCCLIGSRFSCVLRTSSYRQLLGCEEHLHKSHLEGILWYVITVITFGQCLVGLLVYTQLYDRYKEIPNPFSLFNFLLSTLEIWRKKKKESKRKLMWYLCAPPPTKERKEK